jgi:hypothetical protein
MTSGDIVAEEQFCRWRQRPNDAADVGQNPAPSIRSASSELVLQTIERGVAASRWSSSRPGVATTTAAAQRDAAGCRATADTATLDSPCREPVVAVDPSGQLARWRQH